MEPDVAEFILDWTASSALAIYLTLDLCYCQDLSQNTFRSKYVNDQPKMIGNTNCKPGCLNSAKSGQCRHMYTHIYIYIQDVTYVFKVACFFHWNIKTSKRLQIRYASQV